MITFIYGVAVLALPLFIAWALYRINHLATEVAAIHQRLDQLEVITRKQKE